MKSFVIHTLLVFAYVAFAANCVEASRIRGSSTASLASELPGDEDSSSFEEQQQQGFREHPKRSLKILVSSSPTPLPFKGEDGLISRTGGYVNSKAPTVTPTKEPTSAPTKLKAPLKLVEPVRKDKLEKKIQKLELGDAIGLTLAQKEGISRKIDAPMRRNVKRPSRERGAKRSAGVLSRPVKADKLVKTGSKDPVKKGPAGIGLTRHANPSTIKAENRSFRGIQPQIVSAESFKLITQPQAPEPETPATGGIPVSASP